MPANGPADAHGRSGRKKDTRTYADRKVARLAKRDREEAEEKKWWDRLERFGDKVVELVKSGTVGEALVGALGGAMAGIPTMASIVSRTSRGGTRPAELRRRLDGTWYYHDWQAWMHVIRISALWQAAMPNIEADIPTIGLGGIGIGKVKADMRDWFQIDIPVEVVVEFDTDKVFDAGRALADAAAIKKAKAYAHTLAIGAGIMGVPVLAETIRSLKA